MSGFRISIPGQFDDVFYYMGHLIAFTSERRLVSLNLNWALYTHFNEQTVPPIYQFYFLRNDWLEGQHLSLLLGVDEIRDALRSVAERQEPLILTPKWEAPALRGSTLQHGAILDLLAYSRRLYISTTVGLFDVDFSFDDNDLDLGRVRKRHDARCLSTSAKYGTVVASCGSDGLFAGYDDFGALKKSERRSKFTHAEHSSARASWLGYSLTNYMTSTSLQFLSGHRSKARVARTAADEKLASIDPETTDDGAAVVTNLSEDVLSSTQLTNDAVGADYIANSSRHFFVHMPDSSYRLYQRTHRLGRIVGSARNEATGTVGHVLSAHTFHSGIVVESFDCVYLITESGAQRLYDGKALKVRTFPSARHCHNVVGVLDENWLHLISPI
jgi:hypothetical protein